MAAIQPAEDRHLVPIWQPFQDSVAHGELVFPRAQDRDDLDQGLDELEQDWINKRSLEYASDFAAAALIAGQRQRAIGAQELLLSAGGMHKTLGQALTNDHLPYGILALRNRGHIRSLLKDNPRFPLAWVELARIQYSNGHIEAARKSLQVAIHLAPTDRHVLRAQAKFYVSVREPDRALHVLTPAASAGYDPWLLSAEIAVSEIAEKKSKLRRKSRQRLQTAQWPWHAVSELASELATLEDDSGKTASARALFRDSLREPTGNSIAQAVTVAQRARPQWLIETLATHQGDILESAEAAALNAEGIGNFEEAVSHAKRWQNDHPFSREAATYGSSMAALGTQDWQSSLEFAEKGRKVHPQDATLMNNLAYALIESGQRFDEAQRLILEASQSTNAQREFQAVISATIGLYAYRTGEPEQGRRMYDQAISTAHKLGKTRTEALALCLHSREVDDRSAAKKMLERARKLIHSKDELSLHVHEESTRIVDRHDANRSA